MTAFEFHSTTLGDSDALINKRTVLLIFRASATSLPGPEALGGPDPGKNFRIFPVKFRKESTKKKPWKFNFQGFFVRPQGESNPCCGIENPES